MKITLKLLALLSLLPAEMARAQDSVLLSDSSRSQIVQLQSQEHEPIYGQVPYQDTCSREVFSHNDTRCHTTSDTVCSGGGQVCETVNDSVCNSQGCVNVPRRVCRDTPQSCTSVPRQVCNQVAVYRTEYYSCTRYRTEVVGHRLVKTYLHQVEVALADSVNLGSSVLQLAARAHHGSVDVTLQNSFSQSLLLKEIKTLQRQDQGATQNVVSKIIITQGLAASVLSAVTKIQASNLEMGRTGFRMDLSNATEVLDLLKVRVQLVRNRSIGGDKTLIDDVARLSDLSPVAQGQVTKLNVAYSKFGLDQINKLKHDLSVSVSIDVKGDVLNRSDFQGALKHQASQSIEKEKASF